MLHTNINYSVMKIKVCPQKNTTVRDGDYYGTQMQEVNGHTHIHNLKKYLHTSRVEW